MQGGELPAEDEVLKGELGADAEHGAQAGEQAEQQGKHGQVAHNAMSVLRSLCIRAHRRRSRLADESLANRTARSGPTGHHRLLAQDGLDQAAFRVALMTAAIPLRAILRAWTASAQLAWPWFARVL